MNFRRVVRDNALSTERTTVFPATSRIIAIIWHHLYTSVDRKGGFGFSFQVVLTDDSVKVCPCFVVAPVIILNYLLEHLAN